MKIKLPSILQILKDVNAIIETIDKKVGGDIGSCISSREIVCNGDSYTLSLEIFPEHYDQFSGQLFSEFLRDLSKHAFQHFVGKEKQSITLADNSEKLLVQVCKSPASH